MKVEVVLMVVMAAIASAVPVEYSPEVAAARAAHFAAWQAAAAGHGAPLPVQETLVVTTLKLRDAADKAEANAAAKAAAAAAAVSAAAEASENAETDAGQRSAVDQRAAAVSAAMAALAAAADAEAEAVEAAAAAEIAFQRLISERAAAERTAAASAAAAAEADAVARRAVAEARAAAQTQADAEQDLNAIKAKSGASADDVDAAATRAWRAVADFMAADIAARLASAAATEALTVAHLDVLALEKLNVGPAPVQDSEDVRQAKSAFFTAYDAAANQQ